MSDIEPTTSRTVDIDPKRILFRALQNWYFVVASIGLFMSVAYYQNRYSPKIYPVNASIIIREAKETSGGELVYKNVLNDAYRNYLNELYIIKSYPLIEKVVKDLNFEVSFFKEGRILTTESYENFPVKGKLIKTKKPVGSFRFTIIDSLRFSLQVISVDDGGEKHEYRFGEVFEFGGYELMFVSTDTARLRYFFNTPYLISITTPFSLADSYISKLRVTWAEEGAGVINLDIEGTIPQKDIDFLNGLISHYQVMDLEKKNQTADRTISFIQVQLEKIGDSLRYFEDKLNGFKRRNSTTRLNEENKRMVSYLDELQKRKLEFYLKDNYYKYLRTYINQGQNLDQIILPSALGLNDPVIAGLVSKMVDLQMEIRLFVNSDKTENPLISGKLARINIFKSEILESVKSAESIDNIQREFIDNQIRSLESQLDDLPLTEKELIAIQRNYNLQENVFNYLMSKMSEADISRASNISDVLIVNPPIARGAISPKSGRNYALAFILGIATPLLFFALLEFLNTRIQSKEDITKMTKIPFIGGVGHKSGVDNKEVLLNSKSALAESFRALRSNLSYFLNGASGGVFLITSSVSGEGKTFTSINLASVFSLSGKRTLIVGADMRKPKLFSDFDVDNSLGLSSFLSGLSSFDEVVRQTRFQNLDLISSGPVPPNPSELLINGRIEELIEEAKKRYDFIIFDSPPLGIVSDAINLSTYASHTIFLVRQNYTPKQLLATINDHYVNNRIKNVSILLNDIYRSGYGYGYGYGTGYGYGYGYGYNFGKGRRTKNNNDYY